MRASKLIGLPVVDRHGRRFGEIQDLVLDDPVPTTICYALIDTTASEGAVQRTVAVPWSLVAPSGMERTIMLSVSCDALRRMGKVDRS